VTSKPDLILSSSSLPTRILKAEVETIPVIFANIVDPVGQGIVASLARPGGNITGFVNLEASVSGKYVELLREIAPRVVRVVIVYNPTTAPYFEFYLKPFRAAAATLGIEPVAAAVRDLAELNSVLAAQAQQPNTGLIAMPDGFTTSNAREIAALALRYKLPAVSSALISARQGGLLSYGNDIADNYRRAAAYADRIFKGEKASELPVQFPVKFQMIVNLKTAKALDLDVPLLFQQRADEVIE
jgi:putative ABC transport system substrate-binding protein